MVNKRDTRVWRLEEVGRLRPPEGCTTPATVDATMDGIVVLWTDAPGSEALQGRETADNGVTFARTRIPGVRAVIATYTPGSLVAAHVVHVEVKVAFPHVQPLPDGGFVVVGARCAWRPDGPGRNAMTVDADGTVTGWGTLGDGISHLQTDRAGRIWAGYFDEGVYGNFGWGGADRPAPLGASGLVRWSAELTKEWEFSAKDVCIDDCYALNVTDDDVLACTYSDFPLLRIRGGAVEVAPTDGVAGPGSLVFDGDRVAILGAYGDRAAVTTGSLTGSSFRTTGRARLELPDGVGLMCRGSVVNGFDGVTWYRAELGDLLA